LVAPSLGSCLGVAAYDQRRKTGGLIHCFLPSSHADPEKAKERPATYVDTGVSLMLQTLFSGGANKRDIIISVAGGASINDAKGIFEIGSRNFTVLRKLLWKNNLLLSASDVGGEYSRTVMLCIASGEVWVKKNGETSRLI
ncbi:MAG: chemotaxis protein CheD, partial [Deltaproteobacteria bacterium]|nr:chemotaxis protein CheD [Deltaproteobacteria bacterium]